MVLFKFRKWAMGNLKMILKSATLFFFFSFLIMDGVWSVVQAGEPYTPPPGSIERKAIMDTLREGLRSFPDSYSLDFKYMREGLKVPPEIKIKFLVAHLKVKDKWAWMEVEEVENYTISPIYTLLTKEQGRWEIRGIVDPRYVVCSDHHEVCLDVKNYIYQRIRNKFPAVPPEIFPKIECEQQEILKALVKLPALQQMGIIFIVKYLKIQDNWAWIETFPRNYDGTGQFEPIDALLYKEKKGKWLVKEVRPCCGDCEDDPECADIRRYYKKLLRKFPSAPQEIFPKK